MGQPPTEIKFELPPNTSPSAAPAPKVVASTAGNGLGGALAVLVVWGLSDGAGMEVPLIVAMAISTICGIVAGFVAGYLTPPRSV